jgi:hypothetical protein
VIVSLSVRQDRGINYEYIYLYISMHGIDDALVLLRGGPLFIMRFREAYAFPMTCFHRESCIGSCAYSCKAAKYGAADLSRYLYPQKLMSHVRTVQGNDDTLTVISMYVTCM